MDVSCIEKNGTYCLRFACVAFSFRVLNTTQVPLYVFRAVEITMRWQFSLSSSHDVNMVRIDGVRVNGMADRYLYEHKGLEWKRRDINCA